MPHGIIDVDADIWSAICDAIMDDPRIPQRRRDVAYTDPGAGL